MHFVPEPSSPVPNLDMQISPAERIILRLNSAIPGLQTAFDQLEQYYDPEGFLWNEIVPNDAKPSFQRIACAMLYQHFQKLQIVDPTTILDLRVVNYEMWRNTTDGGGKYFWVQPVLEIDLSTPIGGRVTFVVDPAYNRVNTATEERMIVIPKDTIMLADYYGLGLNVISLDITSEVNDLLSSEGLDPDLLNEIRYFSALYL